MTPTQNAARAEQEWRAASARVAELDAEIRTHRDAIGDLESKIQQRWGGGVSPYGETLTTKYAQLTALYEARTREQRHVGKLHEATGLARAAEARPEFDQIVEGLVADALALEVKVAQLHALDNRVTLDGVFAIALPRVVDGTLTNALLALHQSAKDAGIDVESPGNLDILDGSIA
jgi:hypothetical protein